jgi:hypothetical protein
MAFAVDCELAEARITVQAWVPGGHEAGVPVEALVVVVGVVWVGVVSVVTGEDVAVVPEVTVSNPVPAPLVSVPELVLVGDVPAEEFGFVVVAGVDELLFLVTATARNPVPRASRTSARAITRAPLPVVSRGALGVGAPHSRQYRWLGSRGALHSWQCGEFNGGASEPSGGCGVSVT